MAIDYSRLESIHHLLRLKGDLTDQLNRCPRVIKVAENTVKNFETEVEEARTSWQTCKKDADGKQLTMKQREARIEQLKARRNSCDSNKEFQILNEQIAADETANSVLGDEILEMLVRCDELNAKITIARENLAKGQKELERVLSEMNAKQKRLESEIATLDAKLKENETVLTGDLLSEYRRRVGASGPDALAEIDGETCGNCHQVINTQMLSELYQKKPVVCKGCGAILYLSRMQLATREN